LQSSTVSPGSETFENQADESSCDVHLMAFFMQK